MKEWIKNYKDSSRKITFANVKNFFKAIYRKYFHDNWEERQKEWREMQIALKSPECLTKGYCKDCKCDMREKVWEDFECDLGCYPIWMNKEQWLVFEPLINTKLELKFINFLKEINGQIN